VNREGHGIAERHALSLQEQAEEALLMGLRLEEGFELRRLEALGGLTIDRATIAGLENLALVELTSSGRLRITREGRLVTNRVVAELAAALRPVS
jgi:oxygen-independent coproporphyrinogen-3 oxidase